MRIFASHNLKRNKMRFNSNKKDKKKHLKIIIKKWFAILPVKIKGETRWLEFVNVRGYHWKNINNKWFWHGIEFIDNIE
jgi:hypothetical protein